MKKEGLKNIPHGLPRVMLAAVRSGSGKTVLTCGLLDALNRRGLHPVSFKCGPDYIDPMFHRRVLDVDSGNLDTYFAGRDGVRELLFAEGEGHGCAVIEGVMGIYDGAGTDLTGSSYELAGTTATPAVLLVDAAGIGRTVIALIKGILAEDKAHLIRGLILNRISESYWKTLKPVLEEELKRAGYSVCLLGGIPKAGIMDLESRHLGLKLPGEIEGLKEKIRQIGEFLEDHLDMEGLIALMRSACDMEEGTEPCSDAVSAPVAPEPLYGVEGGSAHPILAVAMDDAFCFYYRENFRMLAQRGVRIRFFSPLADRGIPADADGLLLGGGYPELHLEKLSANTEMLASIRAAIDRGIPSLAECGGFMYLHRTVSDPEGRSFSLVGVIDGTCRYTGHLVRFGYLQLKAYSGADPVPPAAGIPAQDPLCAHAVGLRGHEFHYYDSSLNGESMTAAKPGKEQTWPCMIAGGDSLWGFPHLYYGSAPGFVDCFVQRMLAYNRSYHQ